MRTLLVVLVVAVAVGCSPTRDRVVEPPDDPDAVSPAPLLSSPAFEQGEAIPVEHTCDGADVAPPLRWEDVPADAAELVLVVDDPDAPRGTFVHWMVAGLPPEAGGLDGPPPAPAVEGRNDFDDDGWSGPCPPAGDDPHGYRFQLIAVAEPTDLGPGFGADDLQAATEGTALSAAELVGRYGR